MKSFRKEDTRASDELAKYLDMHFYPLLRDYILKKRCISIINMDRITDKKRQLSGIDYEIMYNDYGKKIKTNIDEKAQLYYMDKHIPTFAFEIDSLQNGVLTKGWFVTNNETNYYVLACPLSKNTDLDTVTYNDFYDVECIYVSKQKILSFLAELGITMQNINDMAIDIRNQAIEHFKIDEKHATYYFNCLSERYNNAVYMTISFGISEKPINLVIKKEILHSLEEYSVTI